MIAHSANVLTPGSPAYAALKLGALGGVVGLRTMLVRRDRARHEAETEVAAPAPRSSAGQPSPATSARKRAKRMRR